MAGPAGSTSKLRRKRDAPDTPKEALVAALYSSLARYSMPGAWSNPGSVPPSWCWAKTCSQAKSHTQHRQQQQQQVKQG
jgi:hypothetical protein